MDNENACPHCQETLAHAQTYIDKTKALLARANIAVAANAKIAQDSRASEIDQNNQVGRLLAHIQAMQAVADEAVRCLGAHRSDEPDAVTGARDALGRMPIWVGDVGVKVTRSDRRAVINALRKRGVP